MAGDWKFEELVEFAKSHGWVFQRIRGNCRVFNYKKDSSVLPFECPVHNKKVSIEYVERFKRIVKELENRRQRLRPPV